MRALARAVRGLIAGAAGLGFAAFLAAALVTVADVAGRRVGLPVEGVVDLVQLFVLGGAWLTIPYAFLTGAHVGVDLLTDALPRPARRALALLAGVLAAGLLALMLVQGAEALVRQFAFGDRSQQLGLPIAWYWVPLLAGLVLSILAALTAALDPRA